MIERAKKFYADVIQACNSPRAALIPADVRAALLDLSSLLLEMAKRIEKLEGKK